MSSETGSLHCSPPLLVATVPTMPSSLPQEEKEDLVEASGVLVVEARAVVIARVVQVEV